MCFLHCVFLFSITTNDHQLKHLYPMELQADWLWNWSWSGIPGGTLCIGSVQALVIVSKWKTWKNPSTSCSLRNGHCGDTPVYHGPWYPMVYHHGIPWYTPWYQTHPFLDDSKQQNQAWCFLNLSEDRRASACRCRWCRSHRPSLNPQGFLDWLRIDISKSRLIMINLVCALEHFFPYNNNPVWFIFFRGVETTNQFMVCYYFQHQIGDPMAWISNFEPPGWLDAVSEVFADYIRVMRKLQKARLLQLGGRWTDEHRQYVFFVCVLIDLIVLCVWMCLSCWCPLLDWCMGQVYVLEPAGHDSWKLFETAVRRKIYVVNPIIEQLQWLPRNQWNWSPPTWIIQW